MLEVIHRLGYPLDGVIHAELWATDTIPAELPEMVNFKSKADAFIRDHYGLSVRHVHALDKDGAKLTFEKYFYKVPRGKRAAKNERFSGCIYGFPFTKGGWCLRELKLGAMKRVVKEACYIGIAADEHERITNTQNINQLLPLVDAGWSEADCMSWCEENGLVSPIYKTSVRGGCWFCPKQSLGDLRNLYNNHPELWQLLMKWDKDSPVTFRANGLTVHDFDRRFGMENRGIIPQDRTFRWWMVNQLSLYDFEKMEEQQNDR